MLTPECYQTTGTGASFPPDSKARCKGPSPTYPGSHDKLRVLLLEDNALNVIILQEYLSEMAIPEAHCVDTIAAVNLLAPAVRSGEFDLIVLDIMLPDGESYQFAEKLSRMTSAPIVAYTARTSPDDMARIARSGFSHTIPKPSRLEDLSAVLENCFQSPK